MLLFRQLKNISNFPAGLTSPAVCLFYELFAESSWLIKSTKNRAKTHKDPCPKADSDYLSLRVKNAPEIPKYKFS